MSNADGLNCKDYQYVDELSYGQVWLPVEYIDMTLLFQGLTRGRVPGCNIDDLLPTADVSYVKDKAQNRLISPPPSSYNQE